MSCGARCAATRANGRGARRARPRARSAGGRDGAGSRARRRRASAQEEAAVRRARTAVRAVAHEPPGRLVHPDLAAAAARASRSAAPTASPISGRSPRRATTSPVQTPQHAACRRAARRTGDSSSAARNARCAIVLVRERRSRTTARTASLRSSATLPPWRAHTARPSSWKRSSTGAQRLGVEVRLPVAMREPRDHAGDAPPRVDGDERRAARGAAGARDVVAQDRGLERAQLRRGLDAEAVDERR